jgi:tetratricopeptide (TPR) repeat protein
MVTARHSAFLVAAQLKSVREIGNQLGVRYVLSGSFRRSGTRIRINVDLIEAESENTIWSERYDGSLADIFTFEDAVTATAASRLAVHIDMAERRRLAHHPSLDAYGLILRGQDLSLRFRPESNSHARRLFEQARDLDPRYARSYAAISRTFNVEWRYNWTSDPDAALSEALNLAKRAAEYDDLDARGYSEMGLAHLYKKQHDESLAAYERALELNPNDADLLAEMGDCLVYVRQAARSVELLLQAIRLNPYHPDSYLWYLGDAYFHLGEYERTIQTLLKMRDQSEGHRLMASSYALLGRMEEARHHADALMETHPNFSIEQWRKVPPNKYPEDLEVFVEGLRRAGLR